jgi:hypothetical protein
VGAYAGDVSPTFAPVMNNGQIGGGTHTIAPPIPVNPGDEIYNGFDITDTQSYSYGNGDTVGGESIFGSTNDLECAQQATFDGDCCLSDCGNDFVTFGLTTASDGLYIAVYNDGDGDCIPDNTASGEAYVGISSFANFSDSLFGLIGVRAIGTGDGLDVCGAAGSNFVLIQLNTSPSFGGSSGDWGYNVRSATQRGPCDSVLRDGTRGVGGYGFTTWRTAGSFGYPGANAQLVTVKCGPPVPKCIYQVNSVKIKKDLCGKPSCSDCPYAVGDVICTHDCATGNDCERSLKGTSACPKGGVCKVNAGFVACDICPRGSKRCK